MHTTLAKPRLWQRWKDAQQLTLLATFDDSVTCTRVKEFCQALGRDLGGGCRLIEHVWMFSTLRMRELQEIAAEEAAVSDLVIVSTYQPDGLPEEVKSWLECWLQHVGPRKAVLLALLDRDPEGAPNPARVYLQAAARKAGVEFLLELAETT
jgi:hypothetical protein